MKNLQTKNIFIALLTVLIVSGAFAKPKAQLKNNFYFSSTHYYLEESDNTIQLLRPSDSKGNLPQNNPFENTNENSDDDDIYDKFCYVFHSLFTGLNTSTVFFENTASSRFVVVPFYILFHSWKSFLS